MSSAVQQQTPTASVQSQNKSQGLPSSPVYPADEWFRDEFEILYEHVTNLVDMFFCQFEDIPLESNLSPWIGMSSEFVRYSTMVAGQDDNLGGWNRMLFNSNERWYLLVGMLARIIEAKVFGELLFGASKVQKKQLEDLERSSVEVEGFGRTENRAFHVEAIMGDRPTPNFDIDVARLSKQIVVLFQPLSRFLEDATAHKEGPAPSDEDIFKSIHDTVAMAAYLSIRVRVSPTIFYFHSERPGNLYDPDDQTDMDYPTYIASKSAVIGARDSQHSQSRPYRALVRIALWPSIKRYSAGIGNRESEMGGFKVYNISHSRVVYYWGLEDRGHSVSVDLLTFIEQQRRERRCKFLRVAHDTVRTVGTIAGRAMELLGGYQVAIVITAASAYLIAKDFRQGKDPFGWQ